MDNSIEKDEEKYLRDVNAALVDELEAHRRHAKLCPQHFQNKDPWVRESELIKKQKQSDAFEEAWKEGLGEISRLRRIISAAKNRLERFCECYDDPCEFHRLVEKD